MWIYKRQTAAWSLILSARNVSRNKKKRTVSWNLAGRSSEIPRTYFFPGRLTCSAYKWPKFWRITYFLFKTLGVFSMIFFHQIMKGIRIISYLLYGHSWSLVESDCFFFNPNTPLLGIQILWLCSVQHRIAWQGGSGRAKREKVFCSASRRFTVQGKDYDLLWMLFLWHVFIFFTCPQIKHSLTSEKRVCVCETIKFGPWIFIMWFVVEIIGLSNEVVDRGQCQLDD